MGYDQAPIQSTERRSVTTMASFEKISVIDLSATKTSDLVAAISSACEDWAFFQMTNNDADGGDTDHKFFTKKKDFDKEECELKWAHAQRTLHGLQARDMKMFSDRSKRE